MKDYSLAVVIPCWNEEILLPAMLDCLLKQTYNDWVAFCVDDQSSDKTADIIKSYHSRDSRIHYYCRDKEPKGGQTCRNIGVELAKGAKYLIFMDADDLVAPYCFEQRVRFLEKHPELDFGVFPVMAYSNDIHENEGPVFGVKTFEDDLQAMLGFTAPFDTATNIYMYDSLVKSGIKWDNQIKSYQDVYYNIQILLSGMKYAYAGNAKGDYFYHYTTDGVAYGSKSKRHYDSHLFFIDKVTRMVNEKFGNMYDFYLEAMIAMFLGVFKSSWNPYFRLLRLPWIQCHHGLWLRILLYIITLKKARRIIFYKHRNYSKLQREIWTNSVAKYRKELLERGVSL